MKTSDINARGLTAKQVQEAIDNYYHSITNRELYIKQMQNELEDIECQKSEIKRQLKEGSE